MKIHLSEIDISTWIYETGLGKKIRISLNFPCLSLLTQLFALAFFVIVLCRSGCRQNFFPFSLPSRPAPAARVTWRQLGTSQAPGVHTTRKLYIVYHSCARKAVEECLNPTQFAYRQGGNCTKALISVQHHVSKYLDNQDCKAVRIFTMDFSNCIRFS